MEERTKNKAVEGGTIFHYYILVICKCIDFISLFRHSVCFAFSFKQFSFALHMADENCQRVQTGFDPHRSSKKNNNMNELVKREGFWKLQKLKMAQPYL